MLLVKRILAAAALGSWSAKLVAAESTISSGLRHHNCRPDFFKRILPPNASLLLVEAVPTNGTFAENATNAGFATTASGLPALCAVKIHLPTSNTSGIDFALFLPDQWNQRMMTVGNGGFAGYIVWNQMSSVVRYGFASMSTNTGHYSKDLEASWALNQPESIIDWAYRAMHESTAVSKLIIRAYYHRNNFYSYLASCSNGGRQGMKELTMYPEDYDGIIAGAPAWDLIGEFLWMADFIIPNLLGSEFAHITAVQFSAIHREILNQCDPQDGLVDGIISDPEGCRFVPEKLLCKTLTESAESCLTAPQLQTLYHFLRDWSDTNQTYVYPTLDLGADLSVLGVQVVDIVNTSFPIGFLRNFVYNDTGYSISDFDYLATVRDAQKLYAKTLNVNPAAVDAFAARGGKLFHYQGLADPLVPPLSSLEWWGAMQSHFGPRSQNPSDWYRMFTIPGMGHCFGTDYAAPWYIAGPDQVAGVVGLDFGVPGYMDAQHDVILATVEWVEKRIAPERLMATRWFNDTVALGVERQRPLCPYPAQAVFAGGDVDQASGWDCK